MTFTRRTILSSTLFGAGLLGLRSLATGIPTKLLAGGPQAFADTMSTCANTRPQYVILATSGNGDPLNANAPGTYGGGALATVSHNLDPSMKQTAFTIGGTSTSAAMPWSTPATGGQFSQDILDRMAVFHLMTNTPVHPREPDVLSLMDATAPKEMLPSLLSRQLAPCLGTVQNQPITLGAASPSEGLSYGGQALPIIPPLALKATLTNPTGPLAGLTKLQALRDDTLSKINDIYRRSATRAQKDYLDSVITSQSQIRSINQALLSALGAITDNSVASQITAAVVLIQMNVTPVIAIHIPFGGDNHSDPSLANEALQTTSGLGSIAFLMGQLKDMSNASGNLFDQTSLITLNVFGRTMAAIHTDGRDHNPNHQVSLAIGKPFKGGVFGGLAPVGNDFGATKIGSIAPLDSLASYGQTVMSAVGIDQATISKAISSGQVITEALA